MINRSELNLFSLLQHIVTKVKVKQIKNVFLFSHCRRNLSFLQMGHIDLRLLREKRFGVFQAGVFVWIEH